jgi:hypothetical protein
VFRQEESTHAHSNSRTSIRGSRRSGATSPQQLQPPATEQLLLQVHAKGDQIYTCAGDPAQFAWTLERPDAQLIDKDGKSFGKHFAGPSWKAQDGSRVTGKGVAHAPSPDADSIPWLLVNIVGHEGWATKAQACSPARQPSSASTPKAAKRPRCLFRRLPFLRPEITRSLAPQHCGECQHMRYPKSRLSVE